jgi:hypothetical protein
MKSKVDHIESATIIGDVVLTEVALNELRIVQDGDNDHLDNHCNSIADAICYLAKEACNLDTKDEITDIMISLAYVRDFVQKLKKP